MYNIISNRFASASVSASVLANPQPRHPDAATLKDGDSHLQTPVFSTSPYTTLQPTFGYRFRQHTFTTHGIVSLQGKAMLLTQQQHCDEELMQVFGYCKYIPQK
jgi:hypothetical protein